jgi:hypothetical protein
MATRRTLRGWLDYLDDPKRELTLDEFMAVMAMNTREYARLTLEAVHQNQQATEHLEAIASTLDEIWAMADPRYAALQDKRAAMLNGPALPERVR